MEQSPAFFATELRVGIAEDESDGGEKVGFAGAIASNDHVVLGREGLDDGLVFVTASDVSSGFRRVSGLCATYDLKPWMMICLIYILPRLPSDFNDVSARSEIAL